MAEIPIQVLSTLGSELAEGPAAVADSAQVGANKVLIIRNGSAATITVTILVPGTDFTGGATPDMVQTVAAGKTKVFPLLAAYADAALSGNAAVNYSATATVFRSVLAIY